MYIKLILYSFGPGVQLFNDSYARVFTQPTGDHRDTKAYLYHTLQSICTYIFKAKKRSTVQGHATLLQQLSLNLFIVKVYSALFSFSLVSIVKVTNSTVLQILLAQMDIAVLYKFSLKRCT